jgi:hypothetical protein
VPDGSKLQGVEIFEFRLPAEASISLIVRDGHGLVPGPTTALRTGYRLLIVVPAAASGPTERRQRAESRDYAPGQQVRAGDPRAQRERAAGFYDFHLMPGPARWSTRSLYRSIMPRQL